ncbi:MAG TPA: NfeD family protein [Dehalococcoidia bacterium]|nr:NfeD family protein [Dehalococcoidia bacterium]
MESPFVESLPEELEALFKALSKALFKVSEALSMGITGPIIVVIIFAAAFVILVIFAIVKGQRRKLTTGVENMVGKVAVTQTELNPTGTVLAEGELWTAIAEGSKIKADEEVVITKVAGLKLWVTKKSKEKEDK